MISKLLLFISFKRIKVSLSNSYLFSTTKSAFVQGHVTLKVGSKYAMKGVGVPYVMMVGISKMQILFAEKWDLVQHLKQHIMLPLVKVSAR